MLRSASTCPFCSISDDRVWMANENAVALWDGYPVSKGHALVVPRLHLASLFDLDAGAYGGIWRLVREVRDRLADEHDVAAFNVGANDGVEAGQTVMHAHIHVIPRRPGDVDDPRGGVRWVVPSKAVYWEPK